MRNLKPQNTYKHLLNFASTQATRPILNGIHITNYGHLEATNSHILLRLLNRVPKDQEMVLHPKELREIEGNYPDTDRLVPSSFNANWLLDPIESHQIVKFLKSFDKGTPVTVSAKDSALVIANQSTGTAGAFPLLKCDGDDIGFACNVTYLLYMMAFIADCAPLPVEIGLVSPIRPIVFEVTDAFVGLITPIRTK